MSGTAGAYRLTDAHTSSIHPFVCSFVSSVFVLFDHYRCAAPSNDAGSHA